MISFKNLEDSLGELDLKKSLLISNFLNEFSNLKIYNDVIDVTNDISDDQEFDFSVIFSLSIRDQHSYSCYTISKYMPISNGFVQLIKKNPKVSIQLTFSHGRGCQEMCAELIKKIKFRILRLHSSKNFPISSETIHCGYQNQSYITKLFFNFNLF